MVKMKYLILFADTDYSHFSPPRYNMFRAGDIFSADAPSQSEEIFSALHPRQRVHPIQVPSISVFLSAISGFNVSLLFSFSFLWGPYSHMVHLFSKERLPFTLVYLTTLIGKHEMFKYSSFIHLINSPKPPFILRWAYRVLSSRRLQPSCR